MKEVICKLYKVRRKRGVSFYLFIPMDLVGDSAFPFEKQTQKVKVSIEGERLVVSKTQ